ncbi:MAG: hypothetical protein RMJ59_04595 [Candidatus Nitrosocaldus sp.]|nr:4a-hydroxytetrahydrobiopterin dehydratase [Candidatus Nitrosocaldus sp.]MDW8275643.1 hypothetical protein [Candidatus Nitrosocaldus sp.]
MDDDGKAIDMLRSRGWVYEDGRLHKRYMLGSFTEAIEMVNDIAAVIEGKGLTKVPTIVVEGSSVMLLLPAHDDANVTIARAVDELYEMNYAGDVDEEDELLRRGEDRERARFRSRGPYRKSSSAGLR